MVEKINIREYLKQFASQHVIYKPNPGNAGDCVIASATYQLFDQCCVDYQVYRKGNDTKNAVVMYGGGGNLVGIYTNAREFLGGHHQKASKFILLPHTIAGNEQLLGELGKNTTIICRELESYRHAKEFASNCEVLLADDLALSLDLGRIKSLPRIPPLSARVLACIPELVKNDLLLKYKLRDFKDSRSLSCFRVDPESAMSILPDKNIDLSEVLRYKESPRFVCDWITQSFLMVLDQFETINTDRLHIGIVGGLLGKSTRLYPGNYYKNEAVFEFSIKPRLSNVTFG